MRGNRLSRACCSGDTIIRESIPDCYADEGFTTVSTNPRGEIPLCPYDSCRLLAMNLLSYVENPFKADAKFDFDKFRDHVGKAMHMMDDIIDLELRRSSWIIKKIEDDPEDLDAPRGTGAVEDDPRNGAEGPPHGARHYGRGRHACRPGAALRYAGGDRFRRRGAEDPRAGRLRRVGEAGRRARSLPDLRCRQGGEQPDDRPHPRGRSGALRGDDEGRPPQHRHADHRPDGHHVAHVADHVGHRTGVPHGLQAPPQDQPLGPRHACRLRGRNGRKVPGVQRLPPQFREVAGGERIRHVEALDDLRRRAGPVGRRVALPRRHGQRHRLRPR